MKKSTPVHPYRWHVRENGKVELICAHGIGHYSHLVTMAHNPKFKWLECDDIHGCDGCCGEGAYKDAERDLAQLIRNHRRT